MNASTGTILLVEDEEHDVEFLKRAFGRVGVGTPIHAVGNGEEAVRYLSGTGKYADRQAHPFPRVMITDVKMPQMGGLELLKWIQDNPRYRVVPTIVLTSSTQPEDVQLAFERGASGYMVKPVDFGELEALARAIAEYWRLSLVPSMQAK